MKPKRANYAIFLLMVTLQTSSAWAQSEGPQQSYQQATRLLEQGNAEQATIECKKILARWPRFFPAYSLLGVMSMQLGRLDEAGSYLSTAVKLGPNSAQAHNNLGGYFMARKLPAKAKAEFERATTLEPSDASSWFNLGTAELEIGDPNGAVKALSRALSLGPDDAQIPIALAEARFKAGQPDLALGEVYQMRARAPRDVQLLLTLGILLDRNGRKSEASEFFKAARDEGPQAQSLMLQAARRSMDEGDYDSPFTMLTLLEGSEKGSAEWQELLGYTDFKLGQVQPAVEHLQEAIRLDTKNEDYYLELGEVLTVNNALDTVLVVFEAAQRILPDSVKIQAALSVAYLMVRRNDDAEKTLHSLLERQPDYQVGHKLLFECYDAEHGWEKMEKAADVIRARSPQSSLGWYYGAKAEYELSLQSGGSFAPAQTYIRKALELSPADSRSQFLLARILLAKKDDSEALVALRKASTLDKDDPRILFVLATTLQSLGKTTESRAAYKAFADAQARQKSREYRRLLVDIRWPGSEEPRSMSSPIR